MKAQATNFEFSGYETDWKNRKLSFYYTVLFKGSESQSFTEILELPHAVDISDYNKDLILSLLQNVLLILGISYYKLYCPPKISIKGFSLSKEQSYFWNTVYTKGLSEFFYKNNIDFRGLITFPYEEDATLLHSNNYSISKRDFVRGKTDEKSLVAIGGGKDSIVSIEILKKAGMDFDLCSLNEYPLQKKVADIAGKNVYVIKRTLDVKISELNASREVYNGHIPISAIYAFTSLLHSALYGYSHLIYSNEKSSNYGNIEYHGMNVSHQWSKSYEFEKLFSDYISQYITKNIRYFSLLRPLYEIEITKRFAKYPQYFQVFSSCNRNFKIKDSMKDKLWCCECAKCAFVFSMMASVLPKDKVLSIFGKNMYADNNMIDTFKELLGKKDIKPFDCVGTPDEVIVAFNKALQNGEYNDDIVMKMFKDEIIPIDNDVAKLEKEVFSYGNDENIPEEFRRLIKTK